MAAATEERRNLRAELIGRILAENEAKGIATADRIYHGQFNFAGRLSGPVAHLTGPEAIAAWAAEAKKIKINRTLLVHDEPLLKNKRFALATHDQSAQETVDRIGG